MKQKLIGVGFVDFVGFVGFVSRFARQRVLRSRSEQMRKTLFPFCFDLRKGEDEGEWDKGDLKLVPSDGVNRDRAPQPRGLEIKVSFKHEFLVLPIP